MTAAQTLADYELLLRDNRVEKLWSRLMKEFPQLPEDTRFATYIQEKRLVPRPGGVLAMMPDQAVFVIVSANPHPRHEGEVLKSTALSSLKDWREQEAEGWRFAGKGDPAYPIFKALVKEHLRARKDWSELI